MAQGYWSGGSWVPFEDGQRGTWHGDTYMPGSHDPSNFLTIGQGGSLMDMFSGKQATVPGYGSRVMGPGGNMLGQYYGVAPGTAVLNPGHQFKGHDYQGEYFVSDLAKDDPALASLYQSNPNLRHMSTKDWTDLSYAPGPKGGEFRNIANDTWDLATSPGGMMILGYGAGGLASGGFSAAGQGGATAGTAGAGGGIGGAPGGALYSTPAGTGVNQFGGAFSTPAMTTYAGPTGSALAGTTAPAAMGLSSMGAMASPVTSGAGAEQIEQIPIDNAVGQGQMSHMDMDPYTGGDFSGSAYTSGATTTGLKDMVSSLSTARDVAGLGGALYSMYEGNQMDRAMQEMLAQQGQRQFPHEQYRGLVDQYMNDPMQVLRNNPGYLASVDYLDKAGRRQMAGKGMTNSGNIHHYLADVLGKNAQSWFKDTWDPISEAAGIKADPSAMAQVQQNAMGAIANRQRSALGSLGSAANTFMNSDTGKKLWDWAFA